MTTRPSRLDALVAQLASHGAALDSQRITSVLSGADLSLDDVAPFVHERADSYARRRVARTEVFEMLVMTWRPSQGSAPHDHAGSACVLRVICGRISESTCALGKDGRVARGPDVTHGEGEIVVDRGGGIHVLRNGADETLVTLHVYSPPLAELRRYSARDPGRAPAPLFTRARSTDAGVIGIVGGGFSGTMVAAHVIRRASRAGRPVHVVLFDRHSSFGEGPAYRTSESAHLLNVPAAKMSAWPEQPAHFYEWAHAADPSVKPTDFLPRKLYGEYVRTTFDSVAAEASDAVTAEIRQDEVRAIARSRRGFVLTGASGRETTVDALVLATGHRPPDDPLRRCWSGPRTRYITDPWASLALTAIAPDEPVLILGTGLTTVDVLLTLGREKRDGSIVALSRRGLLPEAHAPTPVKPFEATAWVKELRERPGGLTARSLLRAVRTQIELAAARGEDWRAVIDGMRPHTPKLWSALPEREARRFLRHVRGFWEVYRHRMAPQVAARVSSMRESGVFRPMAGRVLGAVGDANGVTVTVRPRGAALTKTLRVAWVVNCTGPGVDATCGTDPAVASLLRSGDLVADALGLGVIAGPRGEAIDARRRPTSDLIVVGTLRKPQLWESTAVPELRAQAAEAADAVVRFLGDDDLKADRAAPLVASGNL
jgi:uncharacterized NAD(P)/FAD-binding protein YdhS